MIGSYKRNAMILAPLLRENTCQTLTQLQISGSFSRWLVAETPIMEALQEVTRAEWVV